MNHSKNIKLAAMVSVLVVFVLSIIVIFGNIHERNGPKMILEEEDLGVEKNDIGNYAASESALPNPEYTVVSIGDYLS